MRSNREKRFVKVNYITIISLFTLILAGGIVRTTGSGMGCPDWPKCFDRYVPPTSETQLPAGYQDKYIAKRLQKNERFAKTLDLFGYGEVATRIRGDKSISEPEEFNARKTWTEYVNRLIGAITGVFLLGCVLFSAKYLRTRKRIFFLSLINVVLVVFQAWLGSVVVSTNLLAWVVTVHMLLAIAIIAICIYTYFQAKIMHDKRILQSGGSKWPRIIALAAVLLTLVQITLGTEVREQIDAVASQMNHLNRVQWVANAGDVFNYHRDSAILVLIVNALLFIAVRKWYISGLQFRYASYAIVLIGLQVLTGLILAYLGLPAVAQAAHLFLATLLFGSQYYLYLLLKRIKGYRKSSLK